MEANREKRVLGIDPGSYHLGIACIQKRGSSFDLLFAETIHVPQKLDLYARLGLIAAKIQELLNLWDVKEVAVEDIFYARNVRSAFHLGVARGVAIGVCLSRGMKIYEYAPTQVKSVVTGYGRADKDQVKKMVELSLKRKLDLGFDATDAIAIAICHASMRKIEAALTC